MLGFVATDNRFQPVLQSVTHGQHRTGADRPDGQYHHRCRHRRGRLVRVRGRSFPRGFACRQGSLPAGLPEEGQEHHPGHVERGDRRAQKGCPAQQDALDSTCVDSGFDDGVLGEEPGERGHADDGEVAESKRDEGDRHQLSQAAEPAHVGLVIASVHHRTGAEEQSGFEEAVGEQMHDRHRVPGRAESGGEHHVADLAHGGGGQGFLDVVFGAADDRAEQQRYRAHDHHRGLGGRCEVEHRSGPHDQIHPGGHHRRGVDQSRHRRRAFHGIAEPGLQRNLSTLGAGAQ